MRIGELEVPESCPATCPGRRESFQQGGICHRCPIFNCQMVPGDPKLGIVEFRMLEPDDYREDWAVEYIKFWQTGEYPQLLLRKDK